MLFVVFLTCSLIFYRDLPKIAMVTDVGALFFKVVMASAISLHVGFLLWAWSKVCGAISAMLFWCDSKLISLLKKGTI